MSVFSHQGHPYRLCDIEVPQCNTGFVYMIMSTKDQSFTYIGQTNNLPRHLTEHNSGWGSSSTTPMRLRPYALFAYVCGFDCNKHLMLYFEHQWQDRRDQERRRGIHCPKQLARLAHGIIGRIDLEVFNIDQTQLRLILNFED